MYSHVAFRHQTILNLSDISLIFFIVVRTIEECMGLRIVDFLALRIFL